MTNTNQMLQEAVDALQWHYDRGYPDQYTDGPRKRDARILRAIKAHLAAPGAAPSQQPAPARPDEFVCPHCFDEGAAPQAAQSGMVMVPWDPTDAMRRVGADTWHLHDGHLTRVIGDIYRAMIAAAPQAVPFDRTTALVLLQAASKSGDPGAISLAAQLAGAAPCKDCGYVNFKCRCAKTAPQAVPRRVRKIGGSFQHTGTVVAEFTTTAGEPRIVLEFDAPVAGMLHVYRPDQVEAALDAPRAVPQPQPLTDEQFADVVADASLEADLAASPFKLLRFARAILKAQGITAKGADHG